jgi:hypothetical protein
MTGSAGQSDCHNATNYNTGCVVTTKDYSSIDGGNAAARAFNAAGGSGIVALEWREEGIRLWVFPREEGGLQRMIGSSMPDPSVWGRPIADFPSTKCDIGAHFRNQSIIVNIDLCGYMTEATWESSGCKCSAELLCYHAWLILTTPRRPPELCRICGQQPISLPERVLGVWRVPSISGHLI